MIDIPMKSTGPYGHSTLEEISAGKVRGPLERSSLTNGAFASPQSGSGNSSVQEGRTSCGSAPVQSNFPASAPSGNHTVSSFSSPNIPAPVVQGAITTPKAKKPKPVLRNSVMKGQKITLENGTALSLIEAGIGWNTLNPSCDVDVSAFLLGGDGKVPGDDWFVFYGQEVSPDGSCHFVNNCPEDMESITVNLQKLDSSVSRIVFVLTIDSAKEKHLNFSMLSDAYIRIMDRTSGKEITSFQMMDYYSNVTSMMIGEVYKHNGIWKFNAIGNGVDRDLAGLCELYGVQVI